jgi:type IV pilus assembly protein PilM
MSPWRRITSLVKDPAPSHVFELSESGIAFAHHGQLGFEPFPDGTLRASPLEDNLLRADAASEALRRIAPPNGARKRRPAAVILPDYAARVTALDFDSFPSAPEEQRQLVRFRVKKTVPFDIDSAAVAFWAQPAAGSKKVEVIAVTLALEILARYEALFRSANFHPGEVTTATLAALNLYRHQGVGVIAKLAGNILTVVVAAEGRLKLFRCLALDQPSEEEILGVLHPTFAYVEDELGRQVSRLVLCGFPPPSSGLNVPLVEPLRGSRGQATAFNAGLMGYLEGT